LAKVEGSVLGPEGKSVKGVVTQNPEVFYNSERNSCVLISSVFLLDTKETSYNVIDLLTGQSLEWTVVSGAIKARDTLADLEKRYNK
jgi:hypothetical protein